MEEKMEEKRKEQKCRQVRVWINKIEEKPIPSLIMISLLLNAVLELLSKRSLLKLLVFIGTRPHVFLLNAAIIFGCFSLRTLVRRKSFVSVFLCVFWLLIGIVDFVLLGYRVTPFNATDIRLTKDAVAIAGKYLSVWNVVGIILLFIGILAMLAVLFLCLPKSTAHPVYVRGLLTVVISFFTLLGLCSLFHSCGLIEDQFSNLAQAYQDYGLVYCFTNSMLNTGISKPKDYSEENIKQIEESEILEETPVTAYLMHEENPNIVDPMGIKVSENTPNLIFLQLESFSDPLKYEQIQCSEDPIPFYRSLMEQYTSGYLSVPSVGAGTANTEFEVNTGMNLDFFGPGEYPYKTVLQKEICESMSFDLGDIGYHTHAVHNNTGTFYDRNKVFSQLGFDTFTSLEYMSDYETTPTGWAKDNILTGQIKKVLESTAGADFIYTISVQGHGSYPEDRVIENPAVTVTGLDSEEETNAMEYYIQQIHEMDTFVSELVAYLSKQEEPVVLVMYGDHLPSLNLTEEELENGSLFQTEYVVWDNFGLARETQDLEAYQLAAYVLERVGIQTGTMFRFHQSWFQHPPVTEEEQQTYLDDMKKLEYDILYGEKNVFEGEIPYEATDLQMGTYPIETDHVLQQGNSLYVCGWNYTPSSVVYINDEKYETEYVSSNMLYVREADLEEESTIVVSQVSSDNIVLSSTDPYLLQG